MFRRAGRREPPGPYAHVTETMAETDDPIDAVQLDEEGLVKSHLDFAIVGLGASAGGVEALQQFFANAATDTGIAFVVVLHLSTTHESHLDEILQRTTAMPVIRVVGSTPIEPNHVYVISPSLSLSMNDGHLLAAPTPADRKPPTAIDVFFRTLAAVHQERAICVVLSGSGSDGAVGLARVKEYGGVTFAQAPEDAQQDGMPRAAISTGSVDFVMPVADMPARIRGLVDNARRMRLPIDLDPETQPRPIENADELRQAEDALRQIMNLVRVRTRHDFVHYKRGTLLRRIERRMQVHFQPTLHGYLDYLREHPEETGSLFQDLLISVTNFFRDRVAFTALESAGMEHAFAVSRDGVVRLWVAGCATGEEAYSVAMLAHEYADRLPDRPVIQVFATDIDERAIATARSGFYPTSIVTDVSPERLQRFFTKQGHHYRVNKGLRESVLFAVHNLLRDAPFSRLDMVCCRNVLIYLDRQAQADVLDTFSFALRKGGVLFLGTSESPDPGDGAFLPIEKKERLYRADGGELPRTLPSRFNTATATATATEPSPPMRREPPVSAYAKLHRTAVDQYAAPSILLDADHHIVHVADGAARYLEHSKGTPSAHILSNVPPTIGLELRGALQKATRSNRSVEARSIAFPGAHGEGRLNITVVPVDGSPGHPSFLLVVFSEVAETLREAPVSAGDNDTLVAAQFDEEIRHLKQQLQETVEEADSSTEELKASNEELQAINEELRSTTEELETSKEELQSMNEELVTVNSELKLKVDETAKINDDLRNLIASTDLATLFVDDGLRIKRFTPRAVDMFNLIASDIGRPLLDINHRLDYPQLVDDLAAAFDQLKTTERRVDTRDGHHYLARVLPYRTNDDKIAGAVATFTDVTALHSAEERVRAGEEQLRLAAESTRDYAIITTDEAGLVTSWNAGAARVFGYTDAQIVGQSIDLLFVPEDRATGVPDGERQTARTIGRAEDERWHLKKDGTRIYCSGVMTPFVSGELRGFSKIARDVTDSKREQAGRDAMLAREQAERVRVETANRLKDEFLAMMSHELKHPLNLIMVNAELMTRLPGASTEPGFARAAQVIRQAVIGQGKIIDDLLDLSRVSTGKLNLDLSPLELGPIVEAIVNSLHDEAKAKGIELTSDIAPGVEPVMADPVRIDQIVWNLLSNALKFTESGGRVHVVLKIDGRDACLSVADTGKGIAPEFLDRVFEMFSQEYRGPNREQGGLGIGLALVRELVEAHRGRVEARSDGPGRGACFRVWLPFGRESRKPNRGPATAPRALDGLRVLVVDDSKDSLEPFVELLRFEGATTEGATGGRAALAKLDADPYDVVISDLAMPDVDGFQLIREIRAKAPLRGLVAIALSGYGRDKDHRDALEAGFDAHVGKPASIDQIRRVVHEARRKTRGARGR